MPFDGKSPIQRKNRRRHDETAPRLVQNLPPRPWGDSLTFISMVADRMTRVIVRLPRAEISKPGNMPSVSEVVLMGLGPMHGVRNAPLPGTHTRVSKSPQEVLGCRILGNAARPIKRSSWGEMSGQIRSRIRPLIGPCGGTARLCCCI